jgi:two-component system sensor histidine kinase CpxA
VKVSNLVQKNIFTKIKLLFSSFTIKLFVWFWLIAITSIVTTRFISLQLSSEAFDRVVSQTPKNDELRQLHGAAKRIERNKIARFEDLLKIRHKRLVPPPFNIWFKSTDGQQKVTSLFLLPPKHQQVLTNYLSTRVFTQPQTSIFPHTRLIGPVEISINNQPYQLFISRKQSPRHIGQIIQALPYWVRITIPALISFILCLFLAHSFSKPVRLIKKATTKLGQGDFATRVEGVTERNDELGQLANSFNEMAAQLQQNQSAQQRLLGDVSHELRSPMTRLQMALGLAQQELTTDQAREQYLQRCQREIERLDQMIENVLALSRLENTIQKADYQQVNLTSLVQGIINDEQFVADEKSIKIELNLTDNKSTDDISILADQTLLASAITNVLSNAVKYSPEQSNIIVTLSTSQQEVSLTISDSGDGVPEQALAQLFTPFYRVNLARDRKTGGTGLGLAIAKQAVTAHRGKIFAKNNSSKGLSVTIQIPKL